jgi:hypothetical protein
MEIIQNAKKQANKRGQVDIDGDLVEKAESILDILNISQATPFDMSLSDKEKAKMMLSNTIDKYVDTTQNIKHIKTKSDFDDWLNE